MLWLLACQTDPAPPTPAPVPPPAAPAAQAPSPPAPTPQAPAPPAQTAAVVAIGDLHADPQALERVLVLAGLVDTTGAWSGGDSTVVVTGDMIDRGPDSKAVLRRLRELQDAGHAVALLGNHEVMNLTGDLRYVSAEDYAGFGGEAARKAAFATGEEGSWLRTLDAVHQVGDTVFVHGGIDANWAKLGVAGLNRAVREAMATNPTAAVLGPDGPLWNRAYLLSDPAQACAQLGEALTALRATRMVVGHTRQENGRITARCGGHLYGIDTGLSRAYGGPNDAALRIQGATVTELYPPR